MYKKGVVLNLKDFRIKLILYTEKLYVLFNGISFADFEITFKTLIWPNFDVVLKQKYLANKETEFQCSKACTFYIVHSGTECSRKKFIIVI